MKTIIRIPQGAHRSLLPSFRRGWAWLLFLMASVLLTSCRDYYDEMPIQQSEQFAEKDMVYLNLNITTGGNSSTAITRAEDTPAEHGENYIHTIKVWAFGNVGEGQTARRVLFGYAAADFDHDPTDATDLTDFYKTLKLAIPNIYIETGNADFYFLANSESFTNATFSDVTPESTLKNLTLGDSYYASYAGQTIPVGTSDQPCAGLPIARIVKNVPIKTILTDLDDPADPNMTKKPLRVVMQRAVSRIRFYVAREAGTDENFRINNITIGNSTTDLLLSNELVFPSAVEWDAALQSPTTIAQALAAWKAKDVAAIEIPEDAEATYGKDVISVPVPETQAIPAVENVEDVYNALTTNDARIAWITGETNGNDNSSLINVTYLRESDKQVLPLTITYNTGNRTSQAMLSLVANDLLRNHDVIVFAYLKGGGEIVLTVTVMSWELKESTIEYSQTPIISGDPTWKANTYDETMSYPIVEVEEGGIRTITLRAGTTAEYSFEITSPQGFSWIANFTSLTGNPQAFKFVHADNSLSDTFTGTIGTGPTTLKIKAATDAPTESSSAILTFTVRQGEGKNIPLSELSIYKIVQVAN